MQTRREAIAMIAALPAIARAAPAGAASRPVAVDDPAVRTTENVWIAMRDGVRLGARLFLPADGRPAGAVLEYLPYRKRDGYRYRDDVAGPFLAKNGIAYVRVDIRGTGDSEGTIADEYTPAEQADALELIAWIAAQPWCNGRVGMRGISYSAFNSYQAAAKAPPALKAIVAACGTEQRYTDDVHYRGGAMVTDQLTWAAMWSSLLRCPPDPEITGPGWRDAWAARFAAAIPLGATWARHQRWDAFWDVGSPPAADIRIPALLVDGALDGYLNAVPRMMRANPLARGVIGPWAHKWPGYPDGPAANGQPGPAVDWLPHEVRWWRHHLNGEANGVMEGPRFRGFRHDMVAAAVYGRDTPGAFVATAAWPPPGAAVRSLHLNPSGLGSAPQGGRRLRHRASLASGFATRAWYPIEPPSMFWREQSGDDRAALVFDSAPLDRPLDIIGQPRWRIRVRADQPDAKLIVRLTEVTPDGASHLISYGILNLTHRDGHRSPQPLEPGRDYDVEVEGWFACYRFKPGSRIRVAVSAEWWPVIWPSPRLVTLEVTPGESRLDLPTAPVTEAAPPFEIIPGRWIADRSFDRQYRAPHLDGVTATGAPGARTLEAVLGEIAVEPQPVPGANIAQGDGFRLTQRIREDDPNSAETRAEWRSAFRRPGFDITVDAVAVQRSTPTHFLIEERVTGREGGRVVHERGWSEVIARDHL